jgi:predicted nuclease of predicted toxin-antitoxin system
LNLLADEDVDRPVVLRLRQEGHSVLYVAESQASSSDEDVIRLAATSGAILLTADKDFGELVYRQHQVAHGVVLLRLAGLSARTKAHIAANAIAAHRHELPGNFTVVTPGTVRVRRIRR